VYLPDEQKVKSPLEYVMRDGIISNDLLELTVSERAPAVGKQILDLELPKGALLVLIGREDDMVVPTGGTVIEAGDRILLLAGDGTREDVMRKLTPSQELFT
jgi:potassium/hydrogen antiporter